jgi:cytochrome P450
MSYGEEWRARRRLFHQAFNMKVVDAHYPAQEAQVQDLLRRMADAPEKTIEHVKQCVLAAFAYSCD